MSLKRPNTCRYINQNNAPFSGFTGEGYSCFVVSVFANYGTLSSNAISHPVFLPISATSLKKKTMTVFTRFLTLLAVLACSSSIYASTPSNLLGLCANSPTQMEVSGLDLTVGATLTMDVGGTTAGTEHDQIVVSGTVNVMGVDLVVSACAGYVPAFDDEIILIDNDGVDGVNGTFNQSTITINGVVLTVQYDGGDGNDVTLIALTMPALCGTTGSPHTFTGDLTFRSQEDLDDFLFDNAGTNEFYTTVDGSITLRGNNVPSGETPIDDLCNLAALETITGNLTIRDWGMTEATNTVENDPLSAFLALADVGGNVTLNNNNNTGVSSVTSTTLETVGGEINIVNTPAGMIAFSTLTDVEGRFRVVGNSMLTSITANSLINIGNAGNASSANDLDIDDNDLLSSVSFAGVETIEGRASIEENPALVTITLGNGAVISDQLRIFNNDVASGTVNYNLGGVAQATNVVIDNDDSGADYNLIDLSGIIAAENLTIFDAGGDIIIGGASPGTISGNLAIQSHDKLETVVVGQLAVGGNFTVTNNTNSTNFVSVTANVTTIGGGLEFNNGTDQGAPGITTQLPMLTAVGDRVLIDEFATGVIDISALATVGLVVAGDDNFQVSDNVGLTAINANALSEVDHNVVISENDDLVTVTLGASGGLAIGNQLNFNNNSAQNLTTLNFAGVGIVGAGGILIDNNNEGAADIDLSELTNSDGNITIRQSAKTIVLGASGATAGNDVIITDNDLLTTLSGGLAMVGNNFVLGGGNAGLSEFGERYHNERRR